MNTYFTSDTHYFHANIIKYSNRPFSSVDEMNEHLISEHNKIVKPEDELYHLGDFGFASNSKLLEVISRLNGHKHFIYGNHDKAIMSDPKSFIGKNGFESIQYYKEIKRDNVTICLFHYGARVWNKSHHGSYFLYGHSHGSLPPFNRSVDVGVDAKFINNEYRPVSLEEIHNFMSKQVVEKVDHHGD